MTRFEELLDPTRFHDPIDITGRSYGDLQSYLSGIVRIRKAEQHLALMRKEGLIGGPVHLGVGQEAVAVGVSTNLRPSDMVFGAHRSHSHALALGSDVRALFAEVLGKDTGLSRGMGGSMHLWDGPNGFFGSVPIVSGTVPLAVGAGLAVKLSGRDAVSVSYLGDGAMEEGAVHESLNLARVLGVPTLFVVENNLFSSHMHIDLRQPSACTARFAVAHDIPHEIVDGNDVVEVQGAAARLLASARSGEGPVFIEAVTFRWYGHVDWREDIDVGVNRSTKDLANWRARDPLTRLASAMKLAGLWSDEQQSALEAEIELKILTAWDEAMRDPYPSPDALLDRVYAR